jgi:hypothetical protein
LARFIVWAARSQRPQLGFPRASEQTSTASIRECLLDQVPPDPNLDAAKDCLVNGDNGDPFKPGSVAICQISAV